MPSVFVDTNVLVYSEDMAHEQTYGGVHVINPFSELP